MIYLAVFLWFCAGIIVGYRHAWIFDDLGEWIQRRKRSKVSAIDALDLTKRSETVVLVRNSYAGLGSGYLANLAEPKEPDSDYAVTGTPRHIPWHIRKREREASARTKRRQLESFRDIEEGN